LDEAWPSGGTRRKNEDGDRIQDEEQARDEDKVDGVRELIGNVEDGQVGIKGGASGEIGERVRQPALQRKVANH